jgi:glycosyltransferase involved in cell wall biosynthesis
VDAINKGLRAATGDIVGWLNSDDVLLPGALQKVAEAFTKHPEKEWVHGRCEIIDVNDKPIRKWVSRYKHFRARRHTFANLLIENYISQMTTFWRRSVHEHVGYLDCSVGLAFDYDFWLRLAKRSAPLYLEERIACFRWYVTSKSGANFEQQFREAATISARYSGEPARATAWCKRFKIAVFVFLYRCMEGFRTGIVGRNR